jgi:hypothetical protein
MGEGRDYYRYGGKCPQLLSIGSNAHAVIERRPRLAHTSRSLHGKGLTCITAGVGGIWMYVGGGGSTSELWGFKSVGGLGPNAYTHALFADFDLAGQK